MATTPNLGLYKTAATDNVDPDLAFNSNWDLIDASRGLSGARVAIYTTASYSDTLTSTTMTPMATFNLAVAVGTKPLTLWAKLNIRTDTATNLAIGWYDIGSGTVLDTCYYPMNVTGQFYSVWVQCQLDQIPSPPSPGTHNYGIKWQRSGSGTVLAFASTIAGNALMTLEAVEHG